MEVKTYRAKSLQEALQLVRRDLGPEAAVLHTREVSGGLLGLIGGRQVEVMASVDVDVPSRFAAPARMPDDSSQRNTENQAGWRNDSQETSSPAHCIDYRAKFREDLKDQLDDLHSMVEELCHRSENSTRHELAEPFTSLLAELVDADVPGEDARELIERLRTRVEPEDLDDLPLLKTRLARLLEDEIPCSGPIRVWSGSRRLVALVGPTGVGKTTTIAKLAAHFHLREKRRVGLITVDTYRIAAVDQLRTYADIIDLPMEVVATPREMRTALAKLSELELVLLDTAGRSPSDDLKIQELRALLAEAHADEVHLVLSSVASPSSIRNAAEQFAAVGVTGLMLTKLDEATGIGSLLPMLRAGKTPLSYVTTGQNVPDDIAPANARQLARRMLNIDVAACRRDARPNGRLGSASRRDATTLHMEGGQ
jgi:flagellar biosynthesis protein FlhF